MPAIPGTCCLAATWAVLLMLASSGMTAQDEPAQDAPAHPVPEIEVRLVAPHSNQSFWGEHDTTVGDLITELDHAAMDPRQPADAVKIALDDEQAAMRNLFQDSWPRLEGYATLTVQNRDILAARWASESESAPRKTLSVWDTPDSDNFLFETERDALNSPEQITSFLESLFRDEPPLVTAIHYSMLNDPQALGPVGYGMIWAVNSPQVGRFDFFVTGYRTETKGYLCVTSGKSSWGESDALIAERFPPFKERVKKLDITELITRIKSEERDHQPGSHDPGFDRREAILIHELISRTPSSNYLDELDLTRTYHRQGYLNEEGNHSKAGVLRDREYPSELLYYVMKEMCTQGKLRFYEKKIRSLFSSSQHGSSLGLGVMLGNTQDCRDVDFSDLALRAIRGQTDVYIALQYLARNGSTHRLADELETLSVPSHYKNEEQSTVQAIRSRADEKRPAK